MKKISKLISLILCLSLLCSTVAFAAETKQATDSPNMKDILIDSTDDHFIVVSIPESDSRMYTYDLSLLYIIILFKYAAIQQSVVMQNILTYITETRNTTIYEAKFFPVTGNKVNSNYFSSY